MYEVKVLKTLDECEALRSSWENLVASMDYPSPFVHPDWILTVFKANEDRWAPYIVLVKHNDDLLGLLPLYKVRINSMRELRYAGDRYNPDPLGLCCNVEDRGRCVKAIKDYLFQSNQWDVLYLKCLLYDEIKEWNSAAREVYYRKIIAPFLLLPESFNAYLKSFKRKKRYNLNSSVRKFEKAGGKYCAAENSHDAQEILKYLFNLHEKRSVERGIVSSFTGEHILNFHHTVVEEMMEKVWLRFLELEGDIIAILYGFLLHERFFYYQIAHDPKFRAHSPGSILLYNVLKECCAKGVKEFNFLQGDESYKWQWTKDSRVLYTVTMYNSTFNGFLHKHKDKIKRFIKLLVGNFKAKH